MKRKELLILFLLTLAALVVHGYHPWSEDAEIYLPGVEKMLQPQLFPFNAQFFESHARSTFFPNLIAESVRLTHWPLEVVLFSCQIASIFLFLLACWQLMGKCFTAPHARWAGVGLVAALLTIPISGTALYILDPFVNPRNIVAFSSILAIREVLEQKWGQAGLLLVLTALIHPLMSVFVVSYCVLILAVGKFDQRLGALACVLPFGLSLDPPPKAYHLVALAHPFHYITRWEWYEWLGVVGPLIILWWFGHLARKQQRQTLDSMCRALVIYGFIFIPPAIVLSVFGRLEALARLAPMRSYWLLYVLMFLFAGGWLGEYVLKKHLWRWLVLFVPLCAGMCFAQRALYPGDSHIEWPGAKPANQWVQAFAWIRDNTPPDAIFALDPSYMGIPGEDEQGFRAIAQRSRLADNVKDSGAVSMFPAMADEWYRQVQALSGWQNFQLQDFQRLRTNFGITWIVVERPVEGLNCPYKNRIVQVCRL